jgi:hypothetical protein
MQEQEQETLFPSPYPLEFHFSPRHLTEVLCLVNSPNAFGKSSPKKWAIYLDFERQRRESFKL